MNVRSICMRGRPSAKVFCEEGVRLLGDNIGGIGYGERATLRDDVCGCIRSLRLCEARALQKVVTRPGDEKIDERTNLPPTLYLSDLSTECGSLAQHDVARELGCLLDSNKLRL